MRSDAAVRSPSPRYRADLVAAAEPAEAAHPVTAAAHVAAVVAVAVVAAPHAVAAGAAAIDALVVDPVPALGMAAAPDAAAAVIELLVHDKPCVDFTLYLDWRNPWSRWHSTPSGETRTPHLHLAFQMAVR